MNLIPIEDTREEDFIAAVNNKVILRITTQGTDFQIEFHPYVYGRDFLQLPFVWGYIPFNEVYYKLYIDRLSIIEFTDKSFYTVGSVKYYYPQEEEHYAAVEEVNYP